MYHTGGPGWRITLGTSEPLLTALFIRDVAGLSGAGWPLLAPVTPPVRAADHAHLTAAVGGDEALRYQWEQWWQQLMDRVPAPGPGLSPPDFPELRSLPALQRVVAAHFGAAFDWQQRHRDAYAHMSLARETRGEHLILGQLVHNRELELGRKARDFTLTVIELPLAEPRAWFLEPNRVLMSDRLMADPAALVSYVQPVVDLLV